MASDQAAPVPAGWYPDPYKASELRWWDGQSWTDSIHPPAAPEPVAPPVSAPPVSAPPVSAPPVSAPPASAPPVSAEPTPEPEPEPVAEPAIQTPQFRAAPVEVEPVYSAPVNAPQEHAPPVETPLQDQDQSQPSDLDFLAPPATPPLVEPPATPAPSIDTTASAQAPGAALPSRREMRARANIEAGTPAATLTPAPISTPSPTTSPVSSPEPAVPDSATPTAFDWLNADNEQPLGTSQPAAEQVEPAELVTPAASTPDAPAPEVPVSALSEPSVSSEVGSSEFGSAEVGSGEFGTGEFGTGEFETGEFRPDTSGSLPVPAANAWAHDPNAAAAASDEIFTPPATRKSTVAAWIIALTPLIGTFLVVGSVKGPENYPRYAPAGIEWWMLAGGVIAILYIAIIVLAIVDRSKLDWAGYNRPAHWLWALLTAPVYLLVRTIAVKRETGKNSLVLWVWLGCAALVAGGWFAAKAFAPELIDGYTLPFL